MPGHVDDVVDAAEYPEVPIGGLQGAIAGEVGPVVPVGARLVLAVLLVVDLYVPLGLSPDRLEDPGPGVADADVARLAAARGHGIALFVEDHREDAQDSGTAAPRLHRLECGQRAPKKAAVLRLPPRVHDDGLAFP